MRYFMQKTVQVHGRLLNSPKEEGNYSCTSMDYIKIFLLFLVSSTP